METAKVLQLLLLSLGLIACVSGKDVAHELEQLLGRQNDAQERAWGFVANKFAPEEEKVASFWIDQARQELNARVSRPLNKNKAKNIIMFLGDGMPLNTITATRIFKGQQKGNPGEEEMLSFEKFPYTGLSKTYCANAQVPDSACTATAYLCGVKTNIVNIGVTANVDFNNCTASEDPANHVSSIAAWAQAAGKSTGIVTTTSLTHASPAGAYAHTCNRMLECDADKAKYSFGFEGLETCMDLAQQLVTREPGKNFEVMLGGGMGKFLPKNKRDSHGNMGEREDNLNLISYWQALHEKGTLITNRKELHKVDVSKVSNIFGLFESYLMDFHAVADAEKQPTLEEMTELAIKKLQQNEEGFFLFVEGGLIDYSNHANKAGISVDETLEFEKAVQKAIDMTSSEDTMIVVTADHAHPVSISGYPGRGNPILGVNANDVDGNGRDYMTLNYAVGPKQYLDEQGKRRTMSDVVDGRQDFDFPSYIPASMGNHAGDDVGIFASGPYAHLFSGSTQQNLIPHIMAYAACIGDGPKACDV